MMIEGFGLSWAVLLLPLAAFLLLAFLGTRIERTAGRTVLGVVSVLPVAISFFVGCFLTYRLASQEVGHRVVVVGGPPWIDILGLRIPFELTVDPLSMTMTLIITGIGGLIFLYSTGYMAAEREYARFFTYLNLFVASMLLLVLGNNLPLLFVGWEGVGLCSYLLIGFWYKDLANARAANKAFIVNRIGDWGLTMGILLILVMVANAPHPVRDGRLLSYDAFAPILSRELTMHPVYATAVGLLLFIGAAGKSAQFPLYLWLPDAMAGPTPVSALIHAATMVTSGVVLLNRMHMVFEVSSIAAAVVCGIGAFTALFAAVIAFGQTDIKRVLAYSTVSQLGFMFIACGAGAYWAGMFHVTTHAFFKALLFLGAGAVIHAMAHEQDMRKFGGLRKYLPVTTVTMVIGLLAIAAIYPFSGFFSKEALIAPALMTQGYLINGYSVSMTAGWVGLFTAMLTAAYMLRLTALTFFGKERWRDLPEAHPSNAPEPLAAQPAEIEPDPHGFYRASPTAADNEHEHGLDRAHEPREAPPSMWVPLVVLALLSACGGFVLAHNGTFEAWLAPVSATRLAGSGAETTMPELFWISNGAGLLGLLLGLYIVRSERFDDAAWSKGRLWMRRQFGFDDAVSVAAVEGGSQLGTGLETWVEHGLIDRTVDGLYGLVSYVGNGVSLVGKGVVRSYALMMLIGGLLLIGYMTFGANLLRSSPNQNFTTSSPTTP